MRKYKRIASLSGALLLLFTLTLSLVPPGHAFATQIGTRKLTLIGVGSDGGSKPGGTVNHLFNFTLPSAGDASVGSIKFQYCTTAAPVPNGTDCIAPTGIDVNGVTLFSQGGATGFTGMDKTNEDDDTLSNTPLNTVIIERASAQSVLANTAVSYQLNGVVNPTTKATFYVRISTYLSIDGTGAATDTGTVAASTAEPIILNGTMPESLVFCTGGTIGESSNVPDCTTATSGAVDFDRLFSPQDTAQATSQMAASTNAGSGYNITVNGVTMTSGTNTINKIGTADYSRKGVSQFGMNLVENTDFCGVGCNLGANVTQDGGTLYNGEALTGYNTGGDNSTVVGTGAQFQFNNGDSVADSLVGNGTPSTGASDAQIYTVSYIVNVPGSQPAGTYTTTLTYICTASY